MVIKPRNLIDIKSRRLPAGRHGADAFRRIEPRINLHFHKIVLIPAGKIFSVAIVSLSVIFFLFGSVYAPPGNPVFGAADNLEKQREDLEAQLKQYETEIDQLNAQIDTYRRQGQTLKSEIDRLNARVSKINLQIKAVNLSLEQLNYEISDTGVRIETAEEKIQDKKESLAELMQNLYEYDSTSVVEMMLASASFSDFFGNLNDLMLLQDGTRSALLAIVSLRNDLVSQKEILSLKKADAEALKQYQASQRAAVENTKEEKDNLLKITKGEEAKYQAIVQEKQKTAAEIRKQIFRLFGGGELGFEEAYNLAKTAERATGVRAALIMAVLDQESKLGRNVGQCSPEKAMHPTRDLPKFNQLVSNLKSIGDIVPDPLLVSCPIRSDGAYGGAMGPAQFIPSTWLLYSASIAAVTGNNPPNPWRNADAFVGTALYLENSLESSSCIDYASRNKNILPYQFLLERCAAAKYYAGGNWYRFRFAYGDPVVERAAQFQKDIDVLNN